MQSRVLKTSVEYVTDTWAYNKSFEQTLNTFPGGLVLCLFLILGVRIIAYFSLKDFPNVLNNMKSAKRSV